MICMGICAVLGIMLWGSLPYSYAQQSPTSPAPTPSVENVLPESSGGDADTSSSPAPPKRRSSEGVRAPVRSALRQQGGGARTTAGQIGFDPRLRHAIEYVDPPDEGDPITVGDGMTREGKIPVVELLDMISLATNWNIVSSEAVEAIQVRIWGTNRRPAELLRMLRFFGVYYDWNDEERLLSVMTVEEHVSALYGSIERKEFTIKYAEVADMEAILTALKSPNGLIVVDPRTSQIIVWDAPDNLEEMSSTIVRLDQPLTQEVLSLKYIGSDDVLDSVESMLSEVGLAHSDPRSNTILVRDLPSRQEDIRTMMAALDQRLDTRTWTLNYIEPEVVEERLGNLVPEEMGPVSIDEDTHQISVTAIPELLDEIATIIADWDVKPKQVHIDAYLVSASISVSRGLGISWSYFDERAGSPFALRSGSTTPDYSTAPSEGQQLTIGTLPYQVPLYNFWTGNAITDAEGNTVLNPEFKGNRISAVLDFLDEQGEVKILSRPRVTVLDGEEAVFENTEERPYQEGGYYSYGGTDTDNANYNRVIPLQVQFIEVGTILEVTPRINEEGTILMEIAAEDSTAENATVLVGDQESTIPQKRKSKVETAVMVGDSQTLVIGGLRSTNIEDQVNRVPFLGDIPLFGRLFRDTQKDHTQREFLIFLTPSIVDEFTQPEAGKLAKWEEDASGALRHSSKSLMGRMKDRMYRGENEIGISIGHTGTMFCDGEEVEMEGVQTLLNELPNPKTKTLVLRRDPNAPPEIAVEIAEIAMERGIRVEYDEGPSPYVPAKRPATP